MVLVVTTPQLLLKNTMLNRFFKRRSSNLSPELILLLKRELSVTPKNELLYADAFTHKSINSGKNSNNERLEFLGDAVLSSIVGEFLFSNYPEKDEGFLSQMRAKIVSRENLNYYGECLKLEPHISYQRKNAVYKSLLGNVVEALFGAIYLDYGYNKTKRIFIEELMLKKSDLSALAHLNTDYKSQLIVYCQKNKKKLVFKLLEEKDIGKQKLFIMGAFIDDVLKDSAEGSSKRAAEQLTAKKIISIL